MKTLIKLIVALSIQGAAVSQEIVGVGSYVEAPPGVLALELFRKVLEPGLMHKTDDGYAMHFSDDLWSESGMETVISKTVEVLEKNGADPFSPYTDESTIDFNFSSYSLDEMYPYMWLGDAVRMLWVIKVEDSHYMVTLIMDLIYWTHGNCALRR